jgi:hypothetical protein
MSVLNVNDFAKKLKGGGARANLFKVGLSSPIAFVGEGSMDEVAKFLVKGAEIPGSTITPIIIPFRGRQLKISGDRTFDPWTVTVLNDREYSIRRNIEQWMSLMNNHEDNEGTSDTSLYFRDLNVAQLERDGTTTRTYNIIGAWPSDLGPISVSFDNENQIEEYQVTFQYQYWTTDDLLKSTRT